MFGIINNERLFLEVVSFASEKADLIGAFECPSISWAFLILSTESVPELCSRLGSAAGNSLATGTESAGLAIVCSKCGRPGSVRATRFAMRGWHRVQGMLVAEATDRTAIKGM